MCSSERASDAATQAAPRSTAASTSRLRITKGVMARPSVSDQPVTSTVNQRIPNGTPKRRNRASSHACLPNSHVFMFRTSHPAPPSHIRGAGVIDLGLTSALVIAMILDQLDHPVVQAPMAGGPSSPALAAAVSEAGGLGFVAAGYRTAAAVAAEIAAVRAATSRPFGVNVFVPSPDGADRGLLAGYVERVRREAAGYGAPTGEAAWSDDAWEEKLAVLVAERPAVASFAFGCPPPEVIERLGEAGVEVWVTVTEPEEAERAAAAGAGGLVVQGVEAGAHRGTFSD